MLAYACGWVLRIDRMSSSARYDVGYDVAQGVLLFFNVGLLVATLLQLLVEYRVSQDLRLYQSTNACMHVSLLLSCCPSLFSLQLEVLCPGVVCFVHSRLLRSRVSGIRTRAYTSSGRQEVSRSRRVHRHVQY